MSSPQTQANSNPSPNQSLPISTLLKIDVVSAFISAAPCAALVSIVDQAVTQNASGSSTMSKSIKDSLTSMVRKPTVFFGGRAYLAVATVYTSTYITANSVLTYCEENDIEPTAPKLAATSFVNIGLGVTKDSLFAVWFGKDLLTAAAGASMKGGATIAPPPPVARPFPIQSWIMFIFRDIMTVAAGFVFPPVASAWLQETKTIESKPTADIVSQLSVPMIFQVALTPMHLFALDMYNRPGKTVIDRVRFCYGIFGESLGVRLARVGIVYGIAGVGNKEGKKFFREEARQGRGLF